MENMEFTTKERILLVNQYRILAALYPDEKESYERKEEILRRGYVAHYNGLEEWWGEEVSEARSEIVTNVLLLYDDLQQAPEADKAGIPPFYLRFQGFSANEESDLYEYLLFYLDRYFGPKYTNLREPGQDMNSHVPMLRVYNPMLAVYDKFRGDQRFLGRKLTRAEILEILKVGYQKSEELQAL
jgi:uncharacterized protein YfbU (UPF0304 family)